jgi:hypothetical protein
MEPNNICLELLSPTPTYHRVASFRLNLVAYIMVEGGVYAVRKLRGNESFVTKCGKLRQDHATFHVSHVKRSKRRSLEGYRAHCVCVCVCVCVCGAYLQIVVHLKTKWPPVMCTSNRLHWWHEPACLFKSISWWTFPRTELFFCVRSPSCFRFSVLSAVIHPYIQPSEGCIHVALHNVASEYVRVIVASYGYLATYLQ